MASDLIGEQPLRLTDNNPFIYHRPYFEVDREPGRRSQELWDSLVRTGLKRNSVPSVKVNGGNFVFTIATKETPDGFVAVVSVEGIEVWTTPTATQKKDDAYNNARRAVGKAFQNLLNG